MRQPHDRSGDWRPDLFSLGVSKPHYVFNNSFHSHRERNLSIRPARWHWDKLDPCQSPENSTTHPTPIPETAVWWFILEDFCRECFHFCGSRYDGFLSFTLEIVNFHLWQGPQLWALCWTGTVKWWPVWGPSEGQEESSPLPCESSVSLFLKRLYENANNLGVIAWALQTPLLRRNLCPIWASSYHSPMGAHPTSFPFYSHQLQVHTIVSDRIQPSDWPFPFKFCFITWKKMEGNEKEGN